MTDQPHFSRIQPGDILGDLLVKSWDEDRRRWFCTCTCGSVVLRTDRELLKTKIPRCVRCYRAIVKERGHL